MNIYVNAHNVDYTLFEDIRNKYRTFDYKRFKLCVYGDWSDSKLGNWNIICKQFILEQKQVVDATHESIHLTITNDLVEDLLIDYYILNNIEMFMICTSDITFTNLCYKTNKYGKLLYIHIPKHIPKHIEESSGDCSLIDMKKIKKAIKLVFRYINIKISPYNTVVFENFLSVFEEMYEKNIFDRNISQTDIDILINQQFINIFHNEHNVNMIKLE